MSRPFSLLVKPASADCNLRCRYCFYLPKQALYPEAARHRMSMEVLDRLVSSYMATTQPRYSFGWQGGEPTLMGLEFFRAVTLLQRRYGGPGKVVANGLQTNATLLDEPLVRHLARYRFLGGVSIDGPPELHDAYRRGAGGAGSHERVMAGVALLRRYGVEHNALTVVNDLTARDGRALYRYLRDAGFSYHQYIPCVELTDSGEPADFTVRPADWGRFLCEVFDEWRADVPRVSVRLFDSILLRLARGVVAECSMAEECRQYFLVEHNGDVYPCDFFVEPAAMLGNIMEASWDELLRSPVYGSFGSRKSMTHHACGECPYRSLCAGDCLKHRGALAGDPRTLSWLCEGWKAFYGYALPELREMAGRLVEREGRRVAARGRGAVGRNDPCPCGSGRKYKACCGA